MRTIFVKKPSAWQFVTSSTGGVAVEFVAAEGGKIYLQQPNSDMVTDFYYGAAGVGIAAGLKLPKIGKLNVAVKGRSIGGAIVPAEFPNAGKLYILDSFAGQELTEADIQGVCAFLEVGGGIIAGVSATAMLMGMNPAYLAPLVLGAVSPSTALYFDMKLLESATGLLVMAGANVAIQVGGGAGAFIGGLY